MKKQNSEFKTAFVSESGGKLFNNDYFAFVELDDFACYVMADGIEEKVKSKAAKEAVKEIINAFSRNPSMKKRAIKKIMLEVNQVLLKIKSKRNQEASLMIVVTNYESIRYAYAGNTRLSIYRDGKELIKTKDMSLSMQMKDSGKIAKDKVKEHIERNNLKTYAGQKVGFSPFISKKIKLMNLDVINIYTRGLWENIDEGELDDVFEEAKEEPQEVIDIIEDMLLSRQPEKLENYTFFTLFVEKIYFDPNKGKKRKAFIKILVIVIIVIVIVGIIAFKLYSDKQNKIESMNYSFSNTIEYIQDSNFIRANSESAKALELAEDLKRSEIVIEISNYQKLIENIIMADDYIVSGDYKKAQKSYLNSKDRSRYADNLASDYIENQLQLVRDYIAVYDCIYLGDKLMETLDYESASEEYVRAKNLSTKIYFDKGREDAILALSTLYEELKSNNELAMKLSEEEASKETVAAEMIKNGDSAFMDKDYAASIVYYQVAIEKYMELENVERVTFIEEKIEILNSLIQAIEDDTRLADEYFEKGNRLLSDEEYIQAKKNYYLAEDIYMKLDLLTKVSEVQLKIDLLNDLINKEESPL